MARAPLVAALAVAAACLDAPSPAGDAGSPSGLRRRNIDLQPPAVAIAEVPVAIILSSDDQLLAAAREDGRDIHFTTGAGAVLPHEIDKFDPATGALVAWVRVDVDRVIEGEGLELRYGGAPVAEDAGGVWAGYAGVWHLGEDASGDPPQMIDSTGSKSGSTDGPAPLTAPGIAGNALEFDGDGVIEIADPAGMLDFGLDSFSYEAWVKVAPGTSLGSDDHPWYKGGSSVAYKGYDFELGTGNWSAFLNDGTTSDHSTFSAEPVNGAWVQLVAVVDREEQQLRVYRDGLMRSSEVLVVGDLSTDLAAHIGGVDAGSSTNFVGVVDEVRVYDGVLPLSWIQVQHTNLRDPATFLQIGPEEPVP